MHPPNGGCGIKLFRYLILFSNAPNCAFSRVFPQIAREQRPGVVRSKAMVFERLHFAGPRFHFEPPPFCAFATADGQESVVRLSPKTGRKHHCDSFMKGICREDSKCALRL